MVVSYFEFSENVISRIIQEVRKAKKYIKIAMFQIHQKDIFTLLAQKIKAGVEIKILTLPYDSINDDVSDEVTTRFENLKKIGAEIEFIRWNVGDPERTTTAVGRWYLFHGKFIVTDNCAIALSANLTNTAELDAAIFTDDQKTINQFNEKFEYIRKLFVKNEIRDIISTASPDRIQEIFQKPIAADQRHEGYWIKHYPVDICKMDSEIREGLYITPFDTTGRRVYESLVKDAKEYVYVSTESFTDSDFTDFLVNTLIQKKRDNVDFQLCILTDLTSMDFSDRVQKAMRILLASGAVMYTTSKELHAKLVITDRYLVVSSINLNKINLGFDQTKKFWRENTESIFIVSNSALITSAKEQFIQEIDKESTKKVQDELARKAKDQIHTIFRGGFDFKTKDDAKTALSKFIISEEIQAKKTILEIGEGVVKLKDFNESKMVTADDVRKSIALHLIGEGHVDHDQLDSRVKQFDDEFELDRILGLLKEQGFIKIIGSKIEING